MVLKSLVTSWKTARNRIDLNIHTQRTYSWWIFTDFTCLSIQGSFTWFPAVRTQTRRWMQTQFVSDLTLWWSMFFEVAFTASCSFMRRASGWRKITSISSFDSLTAKIFQHWTLSIIDSFSRDELLFLSLQYVYNTEFRLFLFVYQGDAILSLLLLLLLFD
jgi:hypothetical protein